MSAPAPVRAEEGVLLLGPRPVAVGRTCEVWRAAVAGADGASLAVARVASPLAREAGEPYGDFLRAVQVRAAFAPLTPALLGALGADGRVTMTVEEHAGDVALRTLVDVARGAHGEAPVGLALHVGACVAALFARVEAGTSQQLSVSPHDVRVDWRGVVRVVPKPVPRWDERSAGAMAGMVSSPIAWQPPERVLGDRVTDRAEMYTLGVMLWEALVGRHPLHDEAMTPLQRVAATVERDVPPLASARGGVPGEVAALVDRCTRRTAAARYASWAELSAALARAGALEPFDAEALAGLLAQLFGPQRAEALAFAEQVAMLDVAALRRALPTEGLARLPLASLASLPPSARQAARAPRPQGDLTPADVTLADDAPADDTPADVIPDLVVDAWGADARPMLRVPAPAEGPGDALLVDARPVSNAEYARFTIAVERAPPPHWGARTPPLALFDAPVTHVSADDAAAYARWARKRLPTSEEWSRAMAVGASAPGAPRGAVWEWTSSPHPRGGWVVRGGAWRDRPGVAPSPENSSWEDGPAPDVGFRCVMSRA